MISDVESGAGGVVVRPGLFGRLHGPASPYDEPLHEHMTALNTRITALGARTVVSGLGVDEMVAMGSAESAQAALDKAENFDLPWLGQVARAALP